MATPPAVLAPKSENLRTQASPTHPLQDDLSTDFSRVTPPLIVRHNVDGVPAGVDGFHLLAQQGSWRPLVQLTKTVMSANNAAASISDRLVGATYHILGLVKLRMYGAAADELRALGDLHLIDTNCPSESNNNNTTRSVVPFALHFLAASLPHRLGQTQVSIDALYSLMQHCKEQVEAGEGCGGEGEESGVGRSERRQCWERRQDMVLYTLLTLHIQNMDFGVTLQWLDHLLLRHPDDPVVMSQVGYVLLQVGDVDGAGRCFAQAQQQGGETQQVMQHRNQGLLLFASKQYSQAQAEFAKALALDPGDVTSVNNHALCTMYLRDLMGACRFLEENLQTDPVKYIDEALVLNLCSMYDLAWLNGTENKRKLSSWISKIAPDDFDLNCTRL